MRVLVTGASGFLGGVVCAELLQRHHEVHALVRREGSRTAGTAALVGDLADSRLAQSAVESAAPECVVHLAAEIASQRDPAKIEDGQCRWHQGR